jgi:hypothetical protein
LAERSNTIAGQHVLDFWNSGDQSERYKNKVPKQNVTALV